MPGRNLADRPFPRWLEAGLPCSYGDSNSGESYWVVIFTNGWVVLGYATTEIEGDRRARLAAVGLRDQHGIRLSRAATAAEIAALRLNPDYLESMDGDGIEGSSDSDGGDPGGGGDGEGSGGDSGGGSEGSEGGGDSGSGGDSGGSDGGDSGNGGGGGSGGDPEGGGGIEIEVDVDVDVSVPFQREAPNAGLAERPKKVRRNARRRV